MKPIYNSSLKILLIILSLITLLYLLLPGNFLSKTEFGHLFIKFFNINRVTVDCDDNTDIKLVKLDWNGYTVFDGEPKSITESSSYYYGKNEFVVYYNNQVINTYYQMKFSNWHYHFYKFKIKKINKRIISDLMIIGEDNHFEKI